jgi:hypothetical protein
VRDTYSGRETDRHLMTARLWRHFAETLSAATSPARRLAAVDLAVIAAGWSRVDRPFEGPVWFPLTHCHALTVADIPGLAVLGVAGWLFIS